MWRKFICLFYPVLILGLPSNVSAQLPSGWSSQDIGGPVAAGNAHYDSTTQTWTIQADGTGIGGTADQFHYVYKPLVGNGELVARIVSIEPAVNEWSKAGVMMRETLTPGSKYVLMAVTTNTPGGNHGVSFQGRATTNGSSDDASSGAMTAPYWVKLTRSGSTFTGYHSPDGKTWTVQYIATDPTAPTKLYIGLAVSSHVGGTLVTAVIDNGPTKAYDPNPVDQAKDVTVPLVQWTAGVTAAFHDVYFGTNPTPGAAEYKARLPLLQTMYFHTPGLTPGGTYYWRVDEVQADGVTTHKGDVWSFTAATLTAHKPNPADGAKWVDIESDLSWSAGATGIKHDVYFGTSPTDVANGTAGTLKVSQQATKTYDPGAMAQDTTYYWRIDEYDSGGTKYPGTVWSFTTIGASAGIRGYYFNNMNVAGAPALVRIDPKVDFNWGSVSPDAVVNVDQFSVRWTGALEALYSEPYTFTSNSDDGIRVWLNDVLIIGSWIDQSATMHSSAAVNLVAGQLYAIRVEFYENGGDAVAQLYWQSPSTSSQIVPAGALQLPLSAFNPSPPNGATDVKHTPTLRWKAGEKAVKHNVYLGTDAAAVANATTASAGIYRRQQDLKANSYVPSEAPLAWNSTYYWRIDEVNTANIWKGSIWSFTTANFIVVDDFEDYTDDVGSRIFQTWLDGFGYTEPHTGGNGTGSTVGYMQAPFAEQTIVHGARQSMPLRYVNDGSTGTLRYSETERTWNVPQDWTINNVKALTLYFYGAAANVAEQLYMALEDNARHIKVVNHPDLEAVQKAAWQEWNIELTQFSAAGVNLKAIKKMYIGLGNRTSPKAGGTGTIFIDDIRVYRSRCVPSVGKPAADLSGNCVVDAADVDILANLWLDIGVDLAADLDADDHVDLRDFAILADAWLDELLWP